jgi:gas vesicle protein
LVYSADLLKRRRKIAVGDKDTGSSFAIGFIVGAVVGVAIGFLYAPKAGKETRALLKEKAEGLKEKAGEVTEKAKETATEARKRVGEKLGHKEAG